MSMMQPSPNGVSGPGPMSKRTDLPRQGAKQLPNAAYGEQAEFQAIQGGAPMAAAGNPMGDVVPLSAETRRPMEPVTAGVNAGPGPGREILSLPNYDQTQLEDLSMLSKYMPLMASFAESDQSTGTMKAFVKYLRSQS